MRSVVFEGASDDTVIVTVDGVVEEYDVLWFTNQPGDTCGRWVVAVPGGESLLVYAVWTCGWGFAVVPDNRKDDEPGLPPWSISVLPSDRGYSSRLSIVGPDKLWVGGPQRPEE